MASSQQASSAKPTGKKNKAAPAGEQHFISGRVHSIPKDPLAEFPRVTLAAGAVLWRGERNNPEFAIIHRPHYDDWSLPKGKVDPGENVVATVAREIWEETGYRVELGQLLGKVTYPVKNRTKVVYYWVAQALGDEFSENKEVDELRWLPLNKARKLLSYDVDVALLEETTKRLADDITARVLYVRHARAHDRKNWAGDDNLRPLDKKGRRQAEMLVAALAAYRPTAIYSAEPERCQDTAAPLADELGITVDTDHFFGDDGWLDSPKRAKKLFMDVIARGGTPVIVSQGHIIPEMLKAVGDKMLTTAAADATDDVAFDNDQHPRCKKSSVWVLSFAGDKLVAADYLASPLPVM